MKFRTLHLNRKLPRITILLSLTIIFIVNYGIFNSFDNKLIYSAEQRESNFYNKKLGILKISEPIHINDNWSDAKTAGICNGSGTWFNPYIIENLIIDGNGAGSCISIENSNDYFRIEICTVFNAGSGMNDAGIKLNNGSNGYLRINNCSNNHYNGIYLSQCQI